MTHNMLPWKNPVVLISEHVYPDADDLVVGSPEIESPTLNVSFEVIDDAPFLTEDDLLSADEGHLVKDLNDIFALVIVGDKAVVMNTSTDQLNFWSVSTFEIYHANRRKVTLKDGKKIAVSRYWLQSRNRRTYDGLIFSPEREVPGFYNLWRGFAVEPKRGDCSKFLAHIHDNVCSGDDKLYNWVVGWFADVVQHPDKKTGSSLVLRGKQGTGKTIVGKIFGSLLGDHYMPVSDPRLITGRFNAHLTACLLLHADEGFWAGERAAEGKLKDLITGDFHNIEFKGKEVIRVRNYLRLLVTGNPGWMVPAALEERRFAVIDVGEGKIQDHAYFAAIEAEANNGGREALLDYLLKFDLKNVELREIPPTDALLDQKISSLSPEASWWFDVLSAGELPGGCQEKGHCPTWVLFNRYIRHASRQGARRRSIEVQVGSFLKEHVKNLQKLERRTYEIQTRYGKETQEGRIYKFPSLAECRAEFAEKLKQEITWDDPDREDWATAKLNVNEDGEFDSAS